MASGMAAAATLLDNKVVDVVWLSSRPINGDSPSKEAALSRPRTPHADRAGCCYRRRAILSVEKQAPPTLLTDAPEIPLGDFFGISVPTEHFSCI